MSATGDADSPAVAIIVVSVLLVLLVMGAVYFLWAYEKPDFLQLAVVREEQNQQPAKRGTLAYHRRAILARWVRKPR